VGDVAALEAGDGSGVVLDVVDFEFDKDVGFVVLALVFDGGVDVEAGAGDHMGRGMKG